MSKRQYTFLESDNNRVLVIDVDPPAPGQPSNARVRIFVEESRVVLEPSQIEAARAALTVEQAEPAPAELGAQATPIRPRAAKGRA